MIAINLYSFDILNDKQNSRKMLKINVNSDINYVIRRMCMEILKIENITKKYENGEKELYALDDVSFTVNQGEFIAIVGPSGSGKSTLLHMIGGIDKPTNGKVYINGTDISSLKPDKMTIFRRRNIGIVYQFYNLIPTLNAEDNIILPVLLDGKKVDKEKLNEIIKLLKIEDRRKAMPSQLSGGEQQRVSIGRALMNNPSIILADEPTGNLDSKASKEIVEIFKYYNKAYKQTLIIVTHDEKIALQADRIIKLEDGKIIGDEG